MANDPPPIANTSTTTKKYANPWGFGQTIGETVIPGSQELVFGPGQISWGNQAQIIRRALGIHNDVTADTLMSQFVHMQGIALAALQSKMYRAGGYYPANFVPNYGHIRTEDIAAFRDFVTGVAVNPQAGKIGSSLDQAAQYGDTQGVNLNKRAPLVVKLTSPDDLKVVAQKVAQDLFGGNLPEEDLNRFVSSYQQMQTAAQTSAYNLGDPSLTGTLGGAGGTVIAPPDATTEITNEVKAAHPDQVAATAFGNRLNEIISAFTGGRSLTPSG